MVNLMNGILMAALSAEAAVESGAAMKTHWAVIGILGARQPEAGGRIFTSMLLASALIEGGMLFGLIICFMAIFWLR